MKTKNSLLGLRIDLPKTGPGLVVLRIGLTCALLGVATILFTALIFLVVQGFTWEIPRSYQTAVGYGFIAMAVGTTIMIISSMVAAVAQEKGF